MISTRFLEILFWLSVLTILYTYAIYPLVLIILNRAISPRPGARSHRGQEWPSVSLLIAAYNEEEVIANKIENCLALDYPPGLLSIWIASDGSTDKTNEIVRGFVRSRENVHLLEFPRMGKSGVLNESVSHLHAEIIVFSDANAEFSADALKNLTRHFISQEVGCVCGRLIYRNPESVVSGKGESLYWRYETALKRMESRLGCVAGANGAIYAIRKELFRPLPPKTINDDFMISMQIVSMGLRCVYEEQAIAYETVAPTMEAEFQRHVRDGAGHYMAVFRLAGLLNPLVGLRSFVYWSHRVIRWSVPFALLLILMINLPLANIGIYRGFLILQIVLYVLALVGLAKIKSRKMPFLLYIPFYFLNLNLALFVGFLKFISGKQKVTWDSARRT